ncbi:hypothetical protein [Mesorhizobium sp. KR2-14]|uniref:hypothetical protein n=1 Tax=Mesorhizobium sp. KR2-14 TaxID=3156610 RepID=UPI0032B5048B
MKADQDSSGDDRIATLEARVATLEKLAAKLQETISQLQAGAAAKPAEKQLRSRGMMDRPRTSR